jgi:hypothetical protein
MSLTLSHAYRSRIYFSNQLTIYQFQAKVEFLQLLLVLFVFIESKITLFRCYAKTNNPATLGVGLLGLDYHFTYSAIWAYFPDKLQNKNFQTTDFYCKC